jgi:hypothetical protein
LSGTGRTTLRGGYGIYHGRIPNATISDAINRTGTPESQSTFQFNPSTSSGAPVFPNTFTAPPGAELSPNIVLFDPKMKHPFIHEGDLVFEHESGRTRSSRGRIFSAPDAAFQRSLTPTSQRRHRGPAASLAATSTARR